MWDEEGPLGARRVVIAAIVALLVGLAIAFGFVFFILPHIGLGGAAQQAPQKQPPKTVEEKLNALQSNGSASSSASTQAQLNQLNSSLENSSGAGPDQQSDAYQTKLNQLKALQGN